MLTANKHIIISFSIIFIIILIAIFMNQQETPEINNNKINEENNSYYIDLPPIETKGNMFLEEAILQRRSVREYKDQPVSLEKVSQILWAAQGITDETRGFRTSPSAGALYPLFVYIAVGNVENLEPNVYRYLPEEDKLLFIRQGDIRQELYENALYQDSIRQAAFVIIIAADYSITAKKYGQPTEKYVHMEAGHSGQNIYLQSTALNLGTVAIGAFDGQAVKKISGLKNNETALYLMPVGPK